MKYDIIKDVALGNFGIVTTSEARKLGATSSDMNRWVRIGRLEQSVRGVYRLADYPPSKFDPYAIAVASIGEGGRLVGESVLGMLELTTTNPSWIYIGTTKRLRRSLRSDVRVVSVPADEDTAYYEGICCQPLDRAIQYAQSSMLPERIAEAVSAGKRLGLLNRDFTI